MKSDLERNHKQMTFAEYAPEIFQTQKSGASDPLALLSQYPGLEKEWMENPDLSQKFSDSLKKKNPEIDPSGFSGKMLKVLYQAIEDGTLKPFNLRWGNWGTYVHGKFLTANTSEYRNTGNACTLSDVLEMDVPEKYYLSEYTAQKLLSLKDTTVEDLIPPHTHTHTQRGNANSIRDYDNKKNIRKIAERRISDGRQVTESQRLSQGVIQIAMMRSHRNNPNQYRVYSIYGIAPCLNKAEGGGRIPYIYPDEQRTD